MDEEKNDKMTMVLERKITVEFDTRDVLDLRSILRHIIEQGNVSVQDLSNAERIYDKMDC